MIASGKLISAARAILGWSQQDLATAAGLHRNAIAYWERHSVITQKQQPMFGRAGPKIIENALGEQGIVFTCDPAPGLYLCNSPK